MANSVVLLSGATATGYSEVMEPVAKNRTFQAQGSTGSGTGAATIIIQVSNLPSPATGTDVDWITLATITLTLGTTKTTDGFATDAPWRHARAKLSAISGTGATVSAWMGV